MSPLNVFAESIRKWIPLDLVLSLWKIIKLLIQSISIFGPILTAIFCFWEFFFIWPVKALIWIHVAYQICRDTVVTGFPFYLFNVYRSHSSAPFFISDINGLILSFIASNISCFSFSLLPEFLLLMLPFLSCPQMLNTFFFIFSLCFSPLEMSSFTSYDQDHQFFLHPPSAFSILCYI